MKISLNNEKIIFLIRQILSISKLKCFFENNKNILLKLIPNYFMIIGSNINLDCICKIPINHNIQYEKLLNVKIFFNVIKNLSNIEIVNFYFLQKNIFIQTKTLKFILPVLDPNNFYYNTDFISSNIIRISSLKLKKLIELVKFSIAINDIRPSLNGIFFSIKNHILHLVTSDGYRLSSVFEKMDSISNVSLNIILQKNLIVELLKILDHNDITYIHYNTNQIKFTVGNFTIISKLMNDKFPNFNFLFKNNFCYCFKINREKLLKSFLRICIFSDEKNFSIKFIIIDHELILTANLSKVGFAKEKLEIKTDNNFNISFLINYKYIMDIVNIIEDEVLTISISKDLKYLLINNKNNINFSYILTTINYE